MEYGYLLLATVGCLLIPLVYNRVVAYRSFRADKAFGDQHGCLPPPRVKNNRPFGIDNLEQIFRADGEARLMELFWLHIRKTGYTLEQVFLGTKAYGTADPENLEAILSTQFKDWSFGPRPPALIPLLGDGIFTQIGEPWRHSRKLLTPQFAHKHYEDLALFHGYVDNLIANVPVGGGIVDLQPLFFRLTLDVTTAYLFGESINSLKEDWSSGQPSFAKSFDLAQRIVAKRMRLMELYWLIGGKKFRDACNTVHRFADEIIERNLLPKESGKMEQKGKFSFLRTLSEKFENRNALRGQVINTLVAGRDTTAVLLSWTFFHLVRNPAKMARLREEIESACKGKEELTRKDLLEITYLQHILKEILRLYPPVALNQRQAEKRTTLPVGGGPDRKAPVLVPKGTIVSYSVYALHRRPDIWGLDSELFRPERWEELEKPGNLKAYAYLPFNGGPRICLGSDFALTEASYTIVKLIRKYSTIKLPEGTPVELAGDEKQTMTMMLLSTDGCKVELRE